MRSVMISVDVEIDPSSTSREAILHMGRVDVDRVLVCVVFLEVAVVQWSPGMPVVQHGAWACR